MDWSVIDGFSNKDAELFRSTCNHLLGRTFVLRMVWEDGQKRHNPEYTFLARYHQTVQGYLAHLGWDLYHEQYNGYFYVVNNLEENRLALNKDTTAILLALRLIYDEDSERAGLNQDVVCHVRDLLEKVVVNFAILRQRPNMRDLRKSLQLLENHGVIVKLEGRYNEIECRFAILPTILTAVSAERANALVEQMRKTEKSEKSEPEEEIDEEADENSFD